jgi:hypothetical protein
MKSHIAFLLALFLVDSLNAKSYYETILAESKSTASPVLFESLERKVLESPKNPDGYLKLAKLYSQTNERVWAITYAEAFANNTTDLRALKEATTIIYNPMKKGLIFESSSKSTIYFTDISTINSDEKDVQAPYEMSFEMSIAQGFTDNEKLKNPSIRTIYEIRASQIKSWEEKNINPAPLVSYWTMIEKQNLFEAYCYWLLQYSKPAEFGEWYKTHSDEYQRFVEWKKQNPDTLLTASINRIK